MITRTFTKTIYSVKGLDADDKVEIFRLELWDFEAPKGKRAFADMIRRECMKRGLDYVRYIEEGSTAEVRGVSEAEFFKASVHIDR